VVEHMFSILDPWIQSPKPKKKRYFRLTSVIIIVIIYCDIYIISESDKSPVR
jgi:hypothetical protein